MKKMFGMKIGPGGIGVLVCMLLFTFSACYTPTGKPGESTFRSRFKAQRSMDDQNSPLYYDFEDIMVPRALKLDADASYVVQTPGFLTGILVFKGRVERNSLVNFFKRNMVKDNWKAVSLFKSPRSATIMLFRKDNRWCVISINERDYSTYVDIGVAPTMELFPEEDQGLLLK